MDNARTFVTILMCAGRKAKATKEFFVREDGYVEKRPFSAGKFFRYEEKVVSSLHDLAEVLDSLLDEPQKFVIKGAVKAGAADVVRRKIHEPDAAFDAVARPYVMLDIDKYPCPDYFNPADNPGDIVNWVRELLPEPFRWASCYYSFSSSQSVPENLSAKPLSVVSLHLWFWLERSVSDDALKRFFRAGSSPVDTALFSAVQAHYTARPIFSGMRDPLPKRSGLLSGNYDVVPVFDIPEAKNVHARPRPEKEITITERAWSEALDLLLPYYKEGQRDRLCGAIAGGCTAAGGKRRM